MDNCPICLEDLDAASPVLPCGHRCHASCLGQLAEANGWAATRRGTVIPCPSCRQEARVAAPTPVAAFGVGDAVLALWGHKWYPGEVYAVKDGGSAYEIAWHDEDSSNEIPASRVRVDPLTVAVDAPATPDARPAPRSSGPPPAPRAVVPRARPPARPAPAPLPAPLRPHVASTASAWVAVCTHLLEAAKGSTNMKGLRNSLTSRGFICGAAHRNGTIFNARVPADFPCYYDVVGKDYAYDYANTLATLRKYLEGALTLARTGGAYRTDTEYRAWREAIRAKASRFTGVYWDELRGKWRASIRMQGTKVELGAYDDEEDAARAFDAAVAKYELSTGGRYGRTLNFPGEAPLASVLAALPAASPAAAAPPRRSGRAPAPRVIVDAPDERNPSQKRKRPLTLKRKTGMHVGRGVDGASQRLNGKWTNAAMFPGREFDDLDAYRAAKKQHSARRSAYLDQVRDNHWSFGR